MRAVTVRLTDVAQCPKHSLAPSHYNDDGTCLCSELPGQQARIAALRQVRRDALAEIRELQKRG